MKLLEWLITGFITTFIISKIADSINNCTYYNDTKTADCRNLGLKSIPTDLPESTEHLDISSNPLSLNVNSFTYLTTLVSLKMRNLDLRSKSADDFALKILERLEYLDLTGSKFDEFFVFVYPSSIKTLILDSTTFTNPDLRAIEKLEKLSAKSCSLYNFPHCHDYAPLICVDLSDNSLDYLSVPEISKYCLLEKLFVKYPALGSELQSQSAQCRCVELAIWSEEYRIEGMTEKELQCFKYDEGEKNCKVNLTNQIKTRKQCLDSITWVINWRDLILALIFTALILVIFYAIYDRLLRPILYADQFKPSTTPRPRRPLPKPWPTSSHYSPPLIRFPRTPPPVLAGIEEEEEEDED